MVPKKSEGFVNINDNLINQESESNYNFLFKMFLLFFILISLVYLFHGK